MKFEHVYDKLIRVSEQSITLRESGKTSPTKANKAKIVALRGVGKRELKRMLDTAKGK